MRSGGAVHPALVFGLLVSMVIGFIPTMLSLGRWETHLEARKEEVVELGLLDAADVPRGIRTFFDQHGPLLFRLGFEPLGDFRLKKHSMSMARFFLHRDSQTFAEINVSNTLISSVKAVCFFSLTEDGYYLESSNMPCSGKRTSKDGFELMSLPGLSIADVFSKHCQKLKERSGGRPLQVTAEDLQPVIHFGNKRLYEMLLEEGLVTSNPYADFDEQQWLSRKSPAPPTQPITFPAVWDGGVYADPQSFHLS